MYFYVAKAINSQCTRYNNNWHRCKKVKVPGNWAPWRLPFSSSFQSSAVFCSGYSCSTNHPSFPNNCLQALGVWYEAWLNNVLKWCIVSCNNYLHMRLKSSTLGWKIMLNYDAHFGEFTQKWNFLGYDVILPKVSPDLIRSSSKAWFRGFSVFSWQLVHWSCIILCWAHGK